jgi:hypothetical protein
MTHLVEQNLGLRAGSGVDTIAACSAFFFSLPGKNKLKTPNYSAYFLLGDKMDIDEFDNRALKIHAIICSNQDHPDFRMGVASVTYWDTLAQLLRDGFFRKPVLTSNRTWVRKLVIADPKAFAFLAGHIKLEFVVDGHLRYWSGYGIEIKSPQNHPLDYLKAKLGPFLLDFLLGVNVEMFKGTLKDL